MYVYMYVGKSLNHSATHMILIHVTLYLDWHGSYITVFSDLLCSVLLYVYECVLQNDGPTDIHQVSPCEYAVIWNNEAACPIVHITSGDCNIRDVNSNYMFDFNSLKRDTNNPYIVEHEETYEVMPSHKEGTVGVGVCCPLEKKCSACIFLFNVLNSTQIYI